MTSMATGVFLSLRHIKKQPFHLYGAACRQQPMDNIRAKGDQVFHNQLGFFESDFFGSQMKHLHGCAFRRRYSDRKITVLEIGKYLPAILGEEICSRDNNFNAEAIFLEPGRQYQPSLTI